MHLKESFPWPPKQLSPNARVHHMAKAKAAKGYRNDCMMVAMSSWSTLARSMRITDRRLMHIWLVFCPPDNRRRDDDNLIASFKSGRDGIADALSIDDQVFCTHFLRGPKVKGGRVQVLITDSVDHHEALAIIQEIEPMEKVK